MCGELCRSCTGQEDKGVPLGPGVAWGCMALGWGVWRLCRGSLCKERGDIASMRAYGEMLGTHNGWHVSAGVSTSFCI